MVKLFKKINVYATILLIVLLALASIFEPAYLSSTLFTVIYILYALLIFISVIFVENIALKILHLLLTLLIITSVSIKAHNDRYFITIAIGQDVDIPLNESHFNLQLLDFSIHRSGENEKIENFESTFLIDQQDTVRISVNHPYRDKMLRLYQSSYTDLVLFNFVSTDTVQLFEAQSYSLDGKILKFSTYDPVLNKAVVNYNDELFFLDLGHKSKIGNVELSIFPDRLVRATVLEYVETKGHVFLLLVSVLSVLMLFFVRSRRG
jgi:hypothetical protein